MSIICAVFRRVRETCLVTRLAHARDSVIAKDDRLVFQDWAHVLMYGKPYCIKCLFVIFRHFTIRRYASRHPPPPRLIELDG